MVRTIFGGILRMSLAALPVMAAVIAARWALGKAGMPKKITFLLWIAVAFRLVCPVSPEGPLGLVRQSAADAGAAAVEERYMEPTLTYTRSETAPDFEALERQGHVPNPQGQIVVAARAGSPAPLTGGDVLPWVWLAGLAAMTLHAAVSAVRLRRRLAAAVRLSDGVWEADGIAAPFVYGLIRPKIYLPFGLPETDRTHILLHERTHVRRGDPWWKLLAFVILTAHWWNPAAWLCWGLFCRDMEMSCDEAVLQCLGPEVKQAYSRSLVNFATGRHFPAAVPLAFGESGTGSRVKNVLGWKQARSGAVFLAVCLCLVVAAVCCTNAVQPAKTSAADTAEQTVSRAETLCAAKNDEEALLTALGMERTLGPFTWEESPSGCLGLTFSDCPTDSSLRDAVVWKDSMVLLALLDKYDQTSWSWIGRGADSTEESGGLRDTSSWLRAHGLNESIKYYGQSPQRMEQLLDALYPNRSTAAALYALRTPHVGDAVADGKLLAALLDGESFPSCTLELFTAAKPYALQVDFDLRPGTPGLTEPEMTRASFLLLALIDNLDEVRWSFDGGATAGAALTAEQADLYLKSVGLPGAKACGASQETAQILLDCLSENSRAWAAAMFDGDVPFGALTAQTADNGAPYPAHFGMLGQYAYQLPVQVKNCGVLVVTYDHGQRKDQQWGGAGRVGTAGALWRRSGTFQLSWNLGQTENGWDALDWRLYPEKDAAREISFRAAIGQTAFAGPQGLWPGSSWTAILPDDGWTPLAAVARNDDGAAAVLPESVEELKDPSALAAFVGDNDLAAVAYFVTSTGDLSIGP